MADTTTDWGPRVLFDTTTQHHLAGYDIECLKSGKQNVNKLSLFPGQVPLYTDNDEV